MRAGKFVSLLLGPNTLIIFWIGNLECKDKDFNFSVFILPALERMLP